MFEGKYLPIGTQQNPYPSKHYSPNEYIVMKIVCNCCVYV